MSYMKNLLSDILEMLVQTDYDYEMVAKKYKMTPTEIYQIAKDYGDF
jgi:uncharacterized protein YfkK (UPF0435 family)